MLIIWGKKYVYRKIGQVADFCSACRDIQSFLLRRVGLAGHVYYITVGEGNFVGHQRICNTCKTIYNANADQYVSVADKPLPIETLIRQTNPTLREQIAQRLALDEKLKRTPALLSAAEREQLLYEPFIALAAKVDDRYASTHLDKEIGYAFGGFMLALFTVPALLNSLSRDNADLGTLIVLVAMALLLAWQFATAGRRYLRRQIIPILGDALAPLRPTEKEIRGVLTALKNADRKLGSKLRADDLMQHLAMRA